MTAVHMSVEQKKGLAGELYALELLQSIGYTAYLVSDWMANVDIILESLLSVEVKISYPKRHWSGPRGVWRDRWQWDVARLPKNVDSLVILIAVDRNKERWPFLVPSWVFFGRGTKTPCLTSEPLEYAQRGRGYLAPYLLNWSVIDEVLELRRRFHGAQLVLPMFQDIQEWRVSYERV